MIKMNSPRQRFKIDSNNNNNNTNAISSIMHKMDCSQICQLKFWSPHASVWIKIIQGQCKTFFLGSLIYSCLFIMILDLIFLVLWVCNLYIMCLICISPFFFLLLMIHAWIVILFVICKTHLGDCYRVNISKLKLIEALEWIDWKGFSRIKFFIGIYYL